MKKLQFQNLSHIVYSPFLLWTLYKQRVMSSNLEKEVRNPSQLQNNL